MNSSLKKEIVLRFSRARELQTQGNLSNAWAQLGDAHILSQSDPLLHTRSHLMMIHLAFSQRDSKEIFGQLIRTVMAPLASQFKIYPKGNSGKSDISMFKEMPLPQHLEEILKN